MTPDEEWEERANAWNEFFLPEEKCANCGYAYFCHETRVWHRVLATVCPGEKGVFVAVDKEDVSEREVQI